MNKTHNYQVTIEWTGNKGQGTKTYQSYSRNHRIEGQEKTNPILASSDPSFLGDKDRYNPEELLLASISSCHMLWYLHLCTVNKIVVQSYTDRPTGIMEESPNGSGRFTSVSLSPAVVILDSEKIEKANALHHQANEMCFIANSCNFPIDHKPLTTTKDA